ncbi:MAG: hypothetical protein OT477_02690 [Chloroflexi bacterium]|nr:hypothetical protein [Chloroflexota bacterium]
MIDTPQGNLIVGARGRRMAQTKIIVICLAARSPTAVPHQSAAETHNLPHQHHLTPHNIIVGAGGRRMTQTKTIVIPLAARSPTAAPHQSAAETHNLPHQHHLPPAHISLPPRHIIVGARGRRITQTKTIVIPLAAPSPTVVANPLGERARKFPHKHHPFRFRAPPPLHVVCEAPPPLCSSAPLPLCKPTPPLFHPPAPYATMPANQMGLSAGITR